MSETDIKPVRTNSNQHRNMQGSNFSKSQLSYPEDLGSSGQGHYVQFFINEQANANISFSGGSPSATGTTSYGGGGGASTLSVKRAPTKRISSSIALYMPAQVSLQQDAKYGEVEIGASTAAAIAAYKGFQDGGDFSSSAISAMGAFGDVAAESGKEALRTALDTAAPGAKASMQISSGKVTNNRMEMVFEGVSRRSFSFSFKMMPKSENEAKAVDRIVNTFRFYMAPSFDGPSDSSRTFIVPATFDIEYYYSGGANRFLNRIATSVLESCNVTYGGERVQFFRPTSGLNGEGAPPVETNIELQFKELEVITREKIVEGF
tara:strand:- start:303 stop:1262 length:960 start_codon:yes stop_codon:yes gene_type:complete